MADKALDFSDLEDAGMWAPGPRKIAVPPKPDYAGIEERVAAQAGFSIADYAGGKSVPNIAKFPCSKCRGSGRFISWAGRDCGACNRCKGTGKQKTDPELAARKRAVKAERELLERAQAMAKWNAANPAEAEWLAANRQGFDFAQSMIDALAKWGSLTENQLAAVQRCMARQQERAKAAAERKPDAEVGGAGFERMVNAFKTALASGLLYPKFRVGEYVFSPAGAHSKNPGCIYVKRGELYIGKITAEGAFFASRDAADADKAEVARIGSDPLAAAVIHGKETGHCSCCGRFLENEESVRLGIGPICRGKWGL